MALRRLDQKHGPTWYCIGVNPEPWAVGPLTVGRRGGKVFPAIGRNAEVATFQEAIREEMGTGHELLTGRQVIRFYFWRELATYSTPSGKSHQKHIADVTNMQKALEDALQGILFANDRETWDIRSVIVDQGPSVIGKVLFSVAPLVDQPLDIPVECYKLITAVDSEITNPVKDDNSWPPRQ